MPRLDNINPIANSDYLLTVEGISVDGSPVYFTTFSGVKFTRSAAEFNDGLSNNKRYVEGGLKSYQNITISKPHDPEKDQTIIDFLKTKEDGSKFSFRARPMLKTATGNESNTFRGTKAWECSGCDLVSWMCADNVDTADGAQVAKLTIEFRVEQVEYK
ncbi:hypothetical protein ACX27_26720 [Nostoc piscinale CENA21]|uniref:Phage tail protein n=1 Tax=Nostoc piscinale CENA21 TaxID=224013 RepID=A0A0M4SQ37_9NOSO|nr:hypothetical protein [Nostoc piscinale]ALF55622.1 hypothetical protein ACX27_26720 [Nostoc piscinale CENA21]